MSTGNGCSGTGTARGRGSARITVLAFVGLLASLSLAQAAVADQVVTRTFNTGEERFVVPAGVSSIQVVTVGGRGGGGNFGAKATAGAEVAGEFSVAPGETYYVEVGGDAAGERGGFNGGGKGGLVAKGGGGASDIRRSPRASGLFPDTRLLVAGAGGGGGSRYAGGAAGSGGFGGDGGEPGTSLGGGAAGESEECIGFHQQEGSITEATDGGLGFGGDGATCTINVGEKGGGGGGGGYYGGGGGGVDWDYEGTNQGAGGGGGSSLVPVGGTLALAPVGVGPSVRISYVQPPNPPATVTEAASSVSYESATANGTVNPENTSVVSCQFEYGMTTSYGNTAPCAPLPGSGLSPEAVSASLSGLSPGATYHFRVVATNANGTGYGDDEVLNTRPPAPPAVVTGAASQEAAESAMVSASVNPVGTGVLSCTFEYGTVPSYGKSAPCSSLPGSGETPIGVSATLTSLARGTTYHFRIVASNKFGSSAGADHEFATHPHGPATVSSSSPAAGPEAGGTTVTFTGTELQYVTVVKFGAASATNVKALSPTSLTATAPAGVGSVQVVVRNDLGEESPAGEFLYQGTPSVKKLSVKKGPAAGGTVVVITGDHLENASQVRFGSVTATITANSSSSVTVSAPAHTTGTVDVTVITPGGQSAVSSADHFKYDPPTVTKVNPGAGPKAGGTSVTITGSGFTLGAGTTFKFGAANATAVNCTSTTMCTMKTPPAAKTGPVDIRAKSGGKTGKKNPPGDQFTYS